MELSIGENHTELSNFAWCCTEVVVAGLGRCFFVFFSMFSNYARVVYVECLKSVVNFIYLTSSRTEEESRGRAASWFVLILNPFVFISHEEDNFGAREGIGNLFPKVEVAVTFHSLICSSNISFLILFARPGIFGSRFTPASSVVFFTKSVLMNHSSEQFP